MSDPYSTQELHANLWWWWLRLYDSVVEYDDAFEALTSIIKHLSATMCFTYGKLLCSLICCCVTYYRPHHPIQTHNKLSSNSCTQKHFQFMEKSFRIWNETIIKTIGIKKILESRFVCCMKFNERFTHSPSMTCIVLNSWFAWTYWAFDMWLFLKSRQQRCCFRWAVMGISILIPSIITNARQLDWETKNWIMQTIYHGSNVVILQSDTVH